MKFKEFQPVKKNLSYLKKLDSRESMIPTNKSNSRYLICIGVNKDFEPYDADFFNANENGSSSNKAINLSK